MHHNLQPGLKTQQCSQQYNGCDMHVTIGAKGKEEWREKSRLDIAELNVCKQLRQAGQQEGHSLDVLWSRVPMQNQNAMQAVS